MRTLLLVLTLLVVTPPLALTVVVASLLGVKDRPHGIYQWAMRTWVTALLRAAGVRYQLHGAERIRRDGSAVYVSNHVSWFEIFVLAKVLPHFTFIAKSELRKVPIFGRGAEAAGIVFIERANRKAAFDQYARASAQVRGGKSCVVFPEGTRGRDYHLRPFKKGPFVLAIGAEAPIVPVVAHGTIEIMPKGSLRVRPGVVDIHFLEPVQTAGCTYEDRDRIMRTVWSRMADLLQHEYGVGTDEYPIARPDDRPEQETSII